MMLSTTAEESKSIKSLINKFVNNIRRKQLYNVVFYNTVYNKNIDINILHRQYSLWFLYGMYTRHKFPRSQTIQTDSYKHFYDILTKCYEQYDGLFIISNKTQYTITKNKKTNQVIAYIKINPIKKGIVLPNIDDYNIILKSVDLLPHVLNQIVIDYLHYTHPVTLNDILTEMNVSQPPTFHYPLMPSDYFCGTRTESDGKQNSVYKPYKIKEISELIINRMYNAECTCKFSEQINISSFSISIDYDSKNNCPSNSTPYIPYITIKNCSNNNTFLDIFLLTELVTSQIKNIEYTITDLIQIIKKLSLKNLLLYIEKIHEIIDD